MKLHRAAFGLCCVMAMPLIAAAQAPSIANVETEVEVRKFFASYADDLRKHDREAIANRYDRRGAYLMGHGDKTFREFGAIRTRYLKEWTGPEKFDWEDVSVEVISKTSAVVTARFAWTAKAAGVIKCSYTGLFLKHSGEWRIRVEDESCAAPQSETK